LYFERSTIYVYSLHIALNADCAEERTVLVSRQLGDFLVRTKATKTENKEEQCMDIGTVRETREVLSAGFEVNAIVSLWVFGQSLFAKGMDKLHIPDRLVKQSVVDVAQF
jgi:hypothetical protein